MPSATLGDYTATFIRTARHRIRGLEITKMPTTEEAAIFTFPCRVLRALISRSGARKLECYSGNCNIALTYDFYVFLVLFTHLQAVAHWK